MPVCMLSNVSLQQCMCVYVCVRVFRCRLYKDKAGGLHDKHPVYDYYIGAMFMDLGGYSQLKAIAAARPPTAQEVGSKEPVTASMIGSFLFDTSPRGPLEGLGFRAIW